MFGLSSAALGWRSGALVAGKPPFCGFLRSCGAPLASDIKGERDVSAHSPQQYGAVWTSSCVVLQLCSVTLCLVGYSPIAFRVGLHPPAAILVAVGTLAMGHADDLEMAYHESVSNLQGDMEGRTHGRSHLGTIRDYTSQYQTIGNKMMINYTRDETYKNRSGLITIRDTEDMNENY